MAKKFSIKQVLISHGHISCVSTIHDIIRVDCSSCSFHYMVGEEAWAYASFQSIIIEEWDRMHLLYLVEGASRE